MQAGRHELGNVHSMGHVRLCSRILITLLHVNAVGPLQHKMPTPVFPTGSNGQHT